MFFGRSLTCFPSSDGRVETSPQKITLDRNIFLVLCLALPMLTFQIHRMKEAARLTFRSAPHTAGLALLKPRDYEKGAAVEASSAYAVWANLNGTAEPLEVGDVLEAADGSLRIYKYVGFEDARWVLPEIRTGVESLPGATGGSPASNAPA
jgi:hypothetical protein